MNTQLYPEDDVLPHHTNVERVERRIFEIHSHWRHIVTLVVAGVSCFFAASLALILWVSLIFPRADLLSKYILGIVALTIITVTFLAAGSLGFAIGGLRKSDRSINAMEEEIQRMTGSTGYTLNKEVMPLDFFLKALGHLRTALFLLALLWIAISTLLFYWYQFGPATHIVKAHSQRTEQLNLGKD